MKMVSMSAHNNNGFIIKYMYTWYDLYDVLLPKIFIKPVINPNPLWRISK